MIINKVAVIGGGTMGNGIAHVFALHNFEVSLVEMNDELASRAIDTISKNLDRQVKKEIIKEDDKKKVLSKITKIVGLDNVDKEMDLIIEAVFEDKSAKLSIFNKLNNLVKSDCIFASNTSSISITELSTSNRPDKFIGMHFMNPVPMMKLVEIIRGYSTSDETFNSIKLLSEKLGKVPVEVFDYPGFVSNRILMPMINEAIFALMEGVASAEDIDTVMKLGMNHPMGPLTLADFIGLDVCLAIMEVLYNGYNDSKYRPCPLLKKMVAAKKLGRKTGEGFFKYDK
ncbi:MAG: 3-hydroxybutyryl-CoA dehydrogenase [Ignavibacteriaceae bacterium]|jgi:3-hydroxybutyryl-CoA dehydrogenase|nr:3-hydroxybutyryl-CoA dehydrogenase [Ignavibacteriaceae bacterium]MCL4278672.1 3-hydroxybutyryl-CoA dehydrogenase [Ignavibacteriaceae bacterium]MCZ7612986.1 3-hydroxybutyryl-CoA dehydrogenase [Ignavibacteriaceae bacterium]GIK60915.1 MAG: 3-hydroxybutyryl-CoA dehydrogenase [Ignavibacteriota bacterium]GJQ42444.1 MAG: 3-hydroxybutyryl-CoA dehydrogenase [Ignavibacteriaceae bacterium]